MNERTQRYDIPGKERDADRWPIAGGTTLLDGFGNPRGVVRNATVAVNYGQRKKIPQGGADHVYVFGVTLTTGLAASGWVPEASIGATPHQRRAIERMKTHTTRSPRGGVDSTEYRVVGDSVSAEAKYGTLKIKKNSTVKNERATDYLARPNGGAPGVVNLSYRTPGDGGSATTDTVPVGAPFWRAEGVKHVDVQLYYPRTAKQKRGLTTMRFVYGLTDGPATGRRYGWIARDAIDVAPMARNPIAPGPTLPPQTSGIVGARQVAVGGNGRMMLISGCGAAYSKDDPAAPWTFQTGCGNAQQVAVGGNGRMMLISGCGAAFHKDNTFDNFTEQTGCGNARQVAVGDTGRMMLISGCGAAFSKDRPFDNFTEQTGCGNAQQVAVGGGGRMMLISGCGAAFHKDNTHDNFTEQTGCGNAQQVAVGGNGRMMLISGCGAAFSKDRPFDNFTEQTGCGNARQVAVGGGGRMMLISGCGAAFSKDNTFDNFTEQTGCGNARQVAVGGNGRMMLISGCGAAFSKDYTHDNWHQQTACE